MHMRYGREHMRQRFDRCVQGHPLLRIDRDFWGEVINRADKSLRQEEMALDARIEMRQRTERMIYGTVTLAGGEE